MKDANFSFFLIWATITSPLSSTGAKQSAGAIIIAIVGGMIGYLVQKIEPTMLTR